MNWLQHYQKHRARYLIGGITGFFVLNAITLATSRIMEEIAKESDPMPFATWEPFLWEFSSAFMIVALLPMVVYLLGSTYLSWERPIRSALVLAAAAVSFSLIHIAGMVFIREVVYWLMGGDYRFGNLWFGFIYEFRKDLLTFLVLLVIVKGYQYFESRLSSEANLVAYDETSQALSDRVLVKKLGKEFIIKVTDIDWFESSGNYVNLHVQGRIYPSRGTMAELMANLQGQNFLRIHRSHGINLDRVESIEMLPNGAAEVTLLNGSSLAVSKRYRDELKASLAERSI